jgi:hypothetical protein
LAVGYFPHPKWGVEFEVWIPAYMEKPGKQFRDILVGAAAVRRWDRGRFQPQILIGLDYSSPHFSQAFYCGGGSGHVYCVALRRAPCIHARLRRLATKPCEKCGLECRYGGPAIKILTITATLRQDSTCPSSFASIGR